MNPLLGGGAIFLFYAAMLFTLSRRVALVSKAGGVLLLMAMVAFIGRAVMPFAMPFLYRIAAEQTLWLGSSLLVPAGGAFISGAVFVLVTERSAA